MDGLRGASHRTMDHEEWRDGVGVLATTLQPAGGHSSARLGLVDSGSVGGSLRLPLEEKHDINDYSI